MQFLSFGLVSSVAIAIVLIVVLTKAVKFVPQNRAFVVERFGKYTRTLEAGLNFLNPFFDRVAYNRHQCCTNIFCRLVESLGNFQK